MLPSPPPRHYSVDVELPSHLQPIARMRCLRACVIRSLFHLYKPFNLRVSKIPALPESTPTTLLNSKVDQRRSGYFSAHELGQSFGDECETLTAVKKTRHCFLLQCLLFWVRKVSGTRPEALWEFNFKLLKQVNDCCPEAKDTEEESCHTAAVLIFAPFVLQDGHKNGCPKSLHMPRQYKDVHANPDSDCYVLQVTTLNFIFTPVVMGMTLTLVSLSAQHIRLEDCLGGELIFYMCNLNIHQCSFRSSSADYLEYTTQEKATLFSRVCTFPYVHLNLSLLLSMFPALRVAAAVALFMHFMHTLLLYHWYFLPLLFKPHPEIGAAFAGLIICLERCHCAVAPEQIFFYCVFL